MKATRLPLLSRWSLLAVLFLCIGVSPLAAQSNTDPVPRLQEAETTFALGLQAYTNANYSRAYRYFWQIARDLPLNRKTTASWLMAGRALYQDGELDRAIQVLETFTRTYPTTGYTNEAFATIADARKSQTGPQQPQQRILNLGILLPLENEAALLSQALFNGLRLAVDNFNSQGGNTLVRMVFREAPADSAALDATVRSLKQEGVNVVVGPLFSHEAEIAARAAEAEQLPLFVPLATAEDLTNGRQYVFQGNPTFTVQGRAMGRFAVRNLRLDSLGVLSVYNDQNPSSEFMALGFETGVLNAGGSLLFHETLSDESSWYRLTEYVSADTLRSAKAIYLPMPAGEPNTELLLGAALGRIDRIMRDMRLLGNEEWHDLPFKARLSNHAATYATPFHVDTSRTEVRVFEQAYQNLTNELPDPSSEFGYLAFVGYDIGTFIIARLTQSSTAFTTALREAPPYEGLGLRLDFSQGPINEGSFFFRYRNGNLELIR